MKDSKLKIGTPYPSYLIKSSFNLGFKQKIYDLEIQKPHHKEKIGSKRSYNELDEFHSREEPPKLYNFKETKSKPIEEQKYSCHKYSASSIPKPQSNKENSFETLNLEKAKSRTLSRLETAYKRHFTENRSAQNLIGLYNLGNSCYMLLYFLREVNFLIGQQLFSAYRTHS